MDFSSPRARILIVRLFGIKDDDKFTDPVDNESGQYKYQNFFRTLKVAQNQTNNIKSDLSGLKSEISSIKQELGEIVVKEEANAVNRIFV